MYALYVFFQKIKHLARPTPEWGPASEKNRVLQMNHESRIPLNATTPLSELAIPVTISDDAEQMSTQEKISNC